MRFLTGRNVFNGPAEPLFGYLGRQDPSSVFNWASWSDAELMGIGYSTRLNSWPIGWWVFGRAMNNVKNGLAIVGEGAKWPQGETVTDEFATWIPLTRLHIGPPFGANPPSIGYGTQSPADAGSNDYYVQGSIVWNSGAMVGQPTGWMCTVTGNPGTWVAMANL
jgi:hypothetical protein